MNEKYYDILKGYNKSQWGDYVIYGDFGKDDSSEYDYTDLYNQVIKYYNVKTVEESEEQKAIRLAKEKAEKRNNTIDQILGKY